MNDILSFENLNNPIEKMLETYSETSNHLTEEEKQQINDELVEYVPVGNESDEERDDDDACEEEEGADENVLGYQDHQQKKQEFSSHSGGNLSNGVSACSHEEDNELADEEEDSVSKSKVKKRGKGISKRQQQSVQIYTSPHRKAQAVDIHHNKKKLYDFNSLNSSSHSLESSDIRRKKGNKNFRLKLRLPYEVPCPYESFFLMGDVVIEMNFSAINNETFQNCILNLYKPVQRVVYNKNTRCLSMFQASNSEFLIDFGFLSKQLMSYPDKNVHLVGRLIEKYQDIAKLIHLQIKNARSMSGFDPELIAQRRAYFDEQVTAFLKKVDEHQMYFIQKYNTNYDNASFEVSEVGYSRQLLALLGTDENTITSIILRQGKPELYNFESRLKMMLVRMLSIVQGKFKGSQSDFEIYTFDEIRVFAKLTIVPVCIEYPPHLQIRLENYKEINVLAFGLIEVAPSMIQQIITIRQQDRCNRHLKQIVQEFNYTEASEKFLEKYYEISKQNYNAERQNLQKRKRIFDDNEKILIGLNQRQPNGERNSSNSYMQEEHLDRGEEEEIQHSSGRESNQISLNERPTKNLNTTGDVNPSIYTENEPYERNTNSQIISNCPFDTMNSNNCNLSQDDAFNNSQQHSWNASNSVFKADLNFPRQQQCQDFTYLGSNNENDSGKSSPELVPNQPLTYISNISEDAQHSRNPDLRVFTDTYLSNSMHLEQDNSNKNQINNLKVNFTECAALQDMLNADDSLSLYCARNIYHNPYPYNQTIDIEQDLIKLNHFKYIDTKVISQNVTVAHEDNGIYVISKETPQSNQRSLQIASAESNQYHEPFKQLRFEFNINQVS